MKNLSLLLVALAIRKILSMLRARDLNELMHALGFQFYDPDMLMFTLNWVGLHCLSKALCREHV